MMVAASPKQVTALRVRASWCSRVRLERSAGRYPSSSEQFILSSPICKTFTIVRTAFCFAVSMVRSAGCISGPCSRRGLRQQAAAS